MKKIIKAALLVTAAVLMLLCLSSCDVIDELKSERIDRLDENGEKFLYMGNEYIKLENPYKREINLIDSKHCYVVEKNIPLLIIEDMGRSAYYDETRDIIEFRDEYYCIEENYGRYSEVLLNGVTDRYRSLEYVVDTKKHQIFNEYFVLDDETTELIDSTLKNVVGSELRYDELSEPEYLTLESCDKENLLVGEKSIQLYRDTKNNKYGIFMEPYEGMCVIKEFDEKDIDKIAILFEKADFDLAYAKAYGYDRELTGAIAGEAAEAY